MKSVVDYGDCLLIAFVMASGIAEEIFSKKFQDYTSTHLSQIARKIHNISVAVEWNLD